MNFNEDVAGLPAQLVLLLTVTHGTQENTFQNAIEGLFKAAQSQSAKELDEYVADVHVKSLCAEIGWNPRAPVLTESQRQFVEKIMELTTERRVVLLHIFENRFLKMQEGASKFDGGLDSRLARFRRVLSTVIGRTFQSEEMVAEFAAQASPSLLALSLSCMVEFPDHCGSSLHQLKTSAAFKNFGAALSRRNDLADLIGTSHKLSNASYTDILWSFEFQERDLMAIVRKLAGEGKPTETMVEAVFMSCVTKMRNHSVPSQANAEKLQLCSNNLRECCNRSAEIFKDQELVKIQRKCVEILFFSYRPLATSYPFDSQLTVFQVSKPLAEVMFTVDLTARAGLLNQLAIFRAEDLKEKELSKALSDEVQGWLEFKFAHEFFVELGVNRMIVPPTILSGYLAANEQTLLSIINQPKKEIPIPYIEGARPRPRYIKRTTRVDQDY